MKKILIAAITLDGKIAKNKKELVNWTSKQDKAFFRTQTQKAGVVVYGSTTFKTIQKPLKGRLNIVMTREPQKYKNKECTGLLEFTNKSPKKLVDNLIKKGYTSMIIGGGSAIYTLFLKENLVDELYLTIVPKIFGNGVPLFTNLTTTTNLTLIKSSILGKGEVLNTYTLKNK
jgi:dihydrofolate reductase